MSDNTPNTDLVVSTTDTSALDALREGSGSIITTNRSESFLDRLQTFADVQKADDLSDHLGEVLWLKDVIAEAVTFAAVVDPKTGAITQEEANGARTTLVLEDGTTYSAASSVLVKDLGRLFAQAGQPHTWPSPLPIVVTEAGKAPRKYFTLTVDVDAWVKRESAGK